MKHLRYDPLNIVICGIGGQGNVLASEVLSSTMSEMGYHVAVGETYGAAQRGGSVMSHVRISETEELGVLISSGEAQIIIGFEPLETLRMARRYAGPDSLIIYDPRPVYPLGVLQGEQRYPDLEALRSRDPLPGGPGLRGARRRHRHGRGGTPAPPISFCWAPSASCPAPR
jgi:indolepyruvate ferredoxin oxidoreductase beta subunit